MPHAGIAGSCSPGQHDVPGELPFDLDEPIGAMLLQQQSATDHECFACAQIFNVPVLETAHSVAGRTTCATISWLSCTSFTSVLWLFKSHFCSHMGHADANMPQIPEDAEMYEAFSQMSSIWELFQRNPRGRKRQQAPQKERRRQKTRRGVDAVSTSAGHGEPAVLKIDAEQQVTEKTRLMDLLHANRSTGPASPC